MATRDDVLVFEGRTQHEALRRACEVLRVEPRMLRYEILELRTPVTRRNRPRRTRPFCRIRVVGTVDAPDVRAPDIETLRLRAQRAASGQHAEEAMGEGAGWIDSPSPTPDPSSNAGDDADRDEHSDVPWNREAGAAAVGLPDPPQERLGAFVTGVLERMGLPAQVAVADVPGGFRVDIAGLDSEAAEVLEPPVLASLQFLATRLLLAMGIDLRVHLDFRGLRSEHEVRMQRLGEQLAQRCAETGAQIEVYPMEPLDRRLVHLAVAEVDGVTSRSEGSGALRRLVIAPKRREDSE